MKQSHIELFKCARTLFVLFGICGFIHSATGQSANTEYFMSSSYTKTALNPALRPSKGYIGVPGLTNISLGYRTNTFVLNHFLFQGAGENQKTGLFLNENVSYDQFMKGISDRNYFNLDLDLTVLGFGFYAGDAFLSFDASLRADMEMNVPKDFFSFLKRGLSLGGADNKEYNFGNISLDGIVYGQIGLGGSYPFLDNSLLIGTKVKMLSGLMNGRVSLDQMRLNIGRDVWSVSDMQTSMQFVAKGIKPKYDGSGKFDGLDSDDFSFTSNGFGFGLDLGATFKPGYFLEDKSSFLNNFTVSMAVTDLGFINWNKSSSVYLATDPSGPIVITGDKEINFENSKNLFGDLSDAFGDAFDLKEKPDAIEGKTGLKARLNWGIEYAFPEKNINVGLLSTTCFNTTKALSEFTIGGAIKPVAGFEAGLSYSFAYGYFQTIGLSLHLGSFLYITSDYLFPETNSMFIPVSAKAFNLQLGLIVPIGKNH